MRTIHGYWLLCLLALLANTAFAQASIFERLEGEWEGRGKVSGLESSITMTWTPALGGKHQRLDFRNRMEGGVTFEAAAFYTVGKNGKVTGKWFDSFGAAHPISAKVTSDSLAADWGTPETEEGRTVYRFIDENSLEVVDSVKKEDGWREFGRSKYVRSNTLLAKVRMYVDAYNSADISAMGRLMHDKIMWYQIGDGKTETVTAGKEALIKELANYFKGGPRFRSEIERPSVSDRFVSLTERVTGKGKNGETRTQASVVVYEFEGGLIRNVWYFPVIP